MEKEPEQPDDPLDVPKPDAVKEEVNKQEVAKQEVAKQEIAIAEQEVAIAEKEVAIAEQEVAVADQEVSTDAELIKDAQADLAKIDVLVCGACHEVYHFVEEFTEHKSSADKCTGVPAVKCDNEEKHQVWGFTLWKNKQLKLLKESGKDVPGSWEVYQNWVKTGQNEKDLWIAAGRTLQTCHKISTAKVQVSGGGEEDSAKEKDPLALDANSDASEDSKKGVRTPIKTDKEEYIVEKIAGKRFNPKKRQWEYKVKWENYDTETWEPLAHLENCKAMVEEYETKIKTEKMEQKEKTPGRGRGRPKAGQSPTPVKIIQKKTPAVTPVIFSSPGSRPQRTSKQKAVNQVKAWCGNISDSDEPFKRSFDSDSESSSSPFKKMKVGKKGSESEDYTDEETVVPIKTVAAKVIHTYNNGIGKKLPDNVLVPDSKGVVRISQKQLPSLSSGVYIMSRSSGIIKLDSTASKIATSGGQAIVKVGPKVGQTQIKVIKKPDGTTRDNASTKPVKAAAQVASKTPKKDVDKGKKIDVVQLTSTNFKEITRVPPKIFDDDSDDGVEELEFPKDLPLPVPESPPGEFVLDPITGKIAGTEYPDPVPLKTNAPVKPVETLDNIVKLAAADITEEDLQPELNSPTIATNSPAVVVTNNQTPVTSSSTPINKPVHSKATHSILNTAMVNSNILQKTLLTPISRKSQPRVLNQSVGARPQTHVVRSPLMKVGPPRSKPNILPKKYNVAAATSPHIKTVYSKMKSGMPAKIGHTTIHYRTTASAKSYPSASQARNQNATMTRVKSSPKVLNASVSHAAAVTPKPIISMPSLTTENAPATATLLTSSTVGVANSSSTSSDANLSSFTLADGDRPMFITGDDGTIYQVAGQNEDGQTILLTQDSDGQQQCLLVTNEAVQETTQQVENTAQLAMEVEEPPAEAAEEQPVVAQFIRTEPPSPGGTHKVVVMLPDGNIMVTQVTPEEYASLELEK